MDDLDRNPNNIGIIRLLLASAVIVGHAPELIDGNRDREVLSSLWPMVSLASVALNCFFLLSGFLITKSMLRENNIRIFLVRRIMRIVPGYVCAFITSFFVLGAILNIETFKYISEALINMAFLQETPKMTTELILPYPWLNGALWTISYEFRCYILIALLWLCGVLSKKWVVLALTLFFVILTVILGSWTITNILNQFKIDRPLSLAIGRPGAGIGFTATFLVGSSIFLFKRCIDRLINPLSLLFSLLIATFAFRTHYFTEVGRALVLAIPVFWCAFKLPLGKFQRINSKWDISYGTYLYGWPISIFILLRFPSVSPVELALWTVPLAWLAGLLSWVMVERPAKDFAHRRTSRVTIRPMSDVASNEQK